MLIAVLYALAHGLSLLNRGLYWDDWVFWQQDRAVVAEAAREMGSTWPSAINELFFYGQWGITLNRALTFGSLLLAAFLLYQVLRRLPGIERDTAMWIAALFGVFPAFESRIALVMVGYPLSVLLFMTALWLLARSPLPPRSPSRVAAALLFMASFRTGSLLVFFAVVPVVLLLLDPPVTWRPVPVLRRLLRYADLLVLPVAYWVITRVWFVPTGLYAGYNTPGADTTGIVAGLLEGVWIVLRDPFIKAWTALGFTAPLATAGLGAGVAVAGWMRWPLQSTRRWHLLLAAGLVLVVLAVAPYAAVGKVPTSLEWDTRYHLLVPFGAAFILVALAAAASRRIRIASTVSSAVLAVAVLGSVAVHVHSYIRFERDWLKQEAMMEAFRGSETVEDARFLLLQDGTADLDATSRLFYEYSGMLTEVFGDQSRFMARRIYYHGNWEDVARHDVHMPYYKLADFEGGPPDCVVTVTRGELDLRLTSEVLRLMILDWTDREALRAELARALVLHARPYTAEDRRADSYPPLIR